MKSFLLARCFSLTITACVFAVGMSRYRDDAMLLFLTMVPTNGDDDCTCTGAAKHALDVPPTRAGRALRTAENFQIFIFSSKNVLLSALARKSVSRRLVQELLPITAKVNARATK